MLTTAGWQVISEVSASAAVTSAVVGCVEACHECPPSPVRLTGVSERRAGRCVPDLDGRGSTQRTASLEGVRARGIFAGYGAGPGRPGCLKGGTRQAQACESSRPSARATASVRLAAPSWSRPASRPAPAVTKAEADYFAAEDRRDEEEGGYAAIQATKPQTLAYGLTDSPAGLAAWLGESTTTRSDRGARREAVAAPGRRCAYLGSTLVASICSSKCQVAPPSREISARQVNESAVMSVKCHRS